MTEDKTRTYILLGAGGTGSILFLPLLRYLENYHGHRDEKFQLAVVDGDSVAPTNLTRQLFMGRFVNANKAEALLEQYQVSEDIMAVPEYLGDDNVEKLITDGDTVILGVDNFTVRAYAEQRVRSLDNGALINGGNEETDGSIQIYVRRNGENLTPPISHAHPEIKIDDKEDRRKLSCQRIAELPGGGQTIIANMMSATMVLNAVRLLHAAEESDAWADLHHEAHFDLATMKMRPTDLRGIEGWK